MLELSPQPIQPLLDPSLDFIFPIYMMRVLDS